MTGTFYPRLFLLSQFFSLFAIHLVSSRALPAKPYGRPRRIGPRPPSNSLSNPNALTITQNIQALVDTLTADPSFVYSHSEMVLCQLAVEFYEHGDGPHDLYHSSRISDFHDIKCAFRFGGPIEDETRSFFLVGNKFPDHWDQWSLPVPFGPVSPGDLPLSFEWSEVQTHLSLERADQLLKAAGHQPAEQWIGQYDMVTLVRSTANDLAWCFANVIGDYPDTSAQHNYIVYVSTGTVEQTPTCGYFLDSASKDQ